MRLAEAHVLIVGLGLMGGSLALSVREAVGEISGIDRDPSVREAAVKQKVVRWATSPAEGDTLARTADLVVLATPVSALAEAAGQLAPFLKAGAVVTDLGSVKAPVAQALEAILPDHVTYCPGHPMAGSEVAGLAGADARLFENANWVVTRPPPPLLRDLIEKTGARWMQMAPQRHDRLVAASSHLPLMMAVACAEVAIRRGQWDPDGFRRLIAGGFRDTTRVAGGSSEMGADMCLANREELLPLVAAARCSLAQMEAWLEEGARDALVDHLESVRNDLTRLKGGDP